MLWIRNLLLHLVETTRFQKYNDGLLTDTYGPKQIYSDLKRNLVYTQIFNSIVKGTPMQMFNIVRLNFVRFPSHENNAMKFS